MWLALNNLTDVTRLNFFEVALTVTGPRSACHSAESLMLMNIIAWGPQVTPSVRLPPINYCYKSKLSTTYVAGNIENSRRGDISIAATSGFWDIHFFIGS